MDTIINAIVEWLKGVLVDGIMGNLDGLFNNVNEQVGGIASQVGTTPRYTQNVSTMPANTRIVMPSTSISLIMDFTSAEAKEHDKDKFDWAIKGCKKLDEPKVKVTNLDRSMNYADYDHMVQAKFKEMHDNEQRWEEFMIDDAELVLVAYGISSRICKSAVRRARTQGLKLGLIRLISAWPYPRKDCGTSVTD